MSVVTQPPTHRGQVEAVIQAAEELAAQAALAATELAEDGGQPRFITALNEFESVLRAEQVRVEAALDGGRRTEQQELTV